MDEYTTNATNVMENMIDFIPIGTKKTLPFKLHFFSELRSRF